MTCGQESDIVLFLLQEHQNLAWGEHYWHESGAYSRHIMSQELHVLKLISVAWAWLHTEGGSYSEDSETAMNHKFTFGWNSVFVLEMSLDFEMHHGEFTFMRE